MAIETNKQNLLKKAYESGLNTNELCQLYSVSYYTLKKWLQPFTEEIGIKNSIIFTPKQIEVIFLCIGTPL